MPILEIALLCGLGLYTLYDIIDVRIIELNYDWRKDLKEFIKLYDDLN